MEFRGARGRPERGHQTLFVDVTGARDAGLNVSFFTDRAAAARYLRTSAT